MTTDDKPKPSERALKMAARAQETVRKLRDDKAEREHCSRVASEWMKQRTYVLDTELRDLLLRERAVAEARGYERGLAHMRRQPSACSAALEEEQMLTAGLREDLTAARAKHKALVEAARTYNKAIGEHGLESDEAITAWANMVLVLAQAEDRHD